MQGFTHLVLLALLFTISVLVEGSSGNTSQSTETSNSSTTIPTSTGTPNSSVSTPTGSQTTNSTSPTTTTPITSNTTGASNTTSAGVSNTTVTSPTTITTITSNTTGDSNTTSAEVSNTTVSAKPTTTGLYDICLKSNCTGGSSCVGLNTTFFCICQEGYYYNQSKCQEGRVFPGTLTSEQLYTSALEDKGSMTYQEYHYNITKFFAGAFNESVYGQTVIHKVSLSTSEKSNSRVKVTVVNILNKEYNLTEHEVTKAIWRQAVNMYPQTLSYTSENLCDYYNCDQKESGNCADGWRCVCKSGMYRPTPQASHCVPIPCPQSCTSKYNKHCQWDETVARSKCVCLPDYMDAGNGICQKCAFGYRGVNCQDNFQLILTIVGSIAGICILCLMIAMIFMGVRSRSRQENTDQQRMVEDDSQDMAMQRTGYSGPYTERTRFPKAQTGTPSQPHNPYKS